MKINGRTKITGIFGYPIEHTRSPQMHNAAFEAMGLDFCYVPFLVHPDSLEAAVASVRSLNLRGVNVTIPHKENVIPFLDEIDEEARFIGAVNTIVNLEGKLSGYNTDGRGFMRSLSEMGVVARGKKVLIIGAGGAARAVGYYLSSEAKTLFLYGRTKERAERLASDLNNVADTVMVLSEISRIENFEIIINATPLGLKESDPLPFDPSRLIEGQIVCDLIYRETPILIEAANKGCVVLNGQGMLLWQGVLAFELWTGKKPPVEVMRNALAKSSK